MSASRRSGSTDFPVLLLALATALLTLTLGPAETAALQGWELVGSEDESVDSLFTPASGALFAASPYYYPPDQPDQRGLRFVLRSDDDGGSWRPIPLPPRPVIGLAIDPVDHTIVYAAGTEGIYKSDDDARTWRLIHPVTGYDLIWIIVSPADRQVVYARLADARRTRFRLLRSLDGGATWELIREQQAESPSHGCYGAPLTAHPTDRSRIFGHLACELLPIQSAQLDQSVDQGTSWSPMFGPSTHSPIALVSGGGAAPNRFYLLASQLASAYKELAVFRSDDDGRSWAPTGTLCCRRAEFSGSLAIDPRNPDRLFVAPSGLPAGLIVSDNGGATWRDLGGDLGGDPLLDPRPRPQISEIAVGTDGRYLFAATSHGIYRLALP